jgi:hypothetical protein
MDDEKQAAPGPDGGGSGEEGGWLLASVGREMVELAFFQSDEHLDTEASHIRRVARIRR